MKILRPVVNLLLVLVLVTGLAGACAAGLTIWYFSRDLPDYRQLAEYQPPVTTRVYAGDGRLLAEYAGQKRVFVAVKAIPRAVIAAFLAAEDRNFFRHPGVDPLAMARAAMTNVLRGDSTRRPLGASTITQQVARNFLLNRQVSFERKIREALLALKIERVLSKGRILELYLNEIYLGAGTYGVAEAALHYFNKSLDELTIEEAAFLAALPKAPNNYNPARFPNAAKARRDWVIGGMAEHGYITPAQAEAARAVPIVTRRRDATDMVKADYFAEDARRQLLARYGEKALYEGGLAVRTSLDPALQGYADKALRRGLIAYDRRHGWRGPIARLDVSGDWRAGLAALPLPPEANEEGWRFAAVLSVDAGSAVVGLDDGARGHIPLDALRWARPTLEDQRVGPVPRGAADVLKTGDVVLVEATSSSTTPGFALRQIPAVSGALVVLDPHTGRILSLSGGFSYEMGQFNRATQAQRQTGSAIKPFVYLAALDHGFTPSTLILDAPIVIDQGPGLPKWEPTNYEHRFFGPTTLRIGIEQSHDLMTVRVGIATGIDIVAQYVERFGIMDRVPRLPSMLLGAEDTTPLKLTAAYAMLVNGGKRITPTLIDRVQDRDGRTIYRADQRPCAGCRNVAWDGQAPPELPDAREQIADPRSAYQMVSILQGVVERGTGHAIASIGKPLAGKTGTSNGPNDTWFIGFSPDLAAGVFVGFDQPRSLGAHEVGATVAAPIFRDFMADALKDKPARPFRTPSDVVMVRVNPATGQRARPGDRVAIWEPFKPGTEPNPDSDSAVLDGGSGTSTPGSNSSRMPSSASPDVGMGGLY